jgi:uncharacterized protein (TIGR00369 family)
VGDYRPSETPKQTVTNESESERIEQIRERFDRSTFHSSWLGLHLDRLAAGEATVSLDIEDRHRNLVGTLHGGMISTLADTATGLAMATALERGQTWTTTSLAVTFLAPGRSGGASATGRVVKAGRRFGYAEADVTDDSGRLLARATATFAIMPEPEAQ